MKTPYHPDQKILARYADVLVNFALGGGKGIKKGDTVMVYAEDFAKRLYAEVVKAIWKAGGNVISRYSPSDEPWFKMDRLFYELASEQQLSHFPEKYLKGMIEESDHSLYIISDTDPRGLQGVDSKKMMKRGMTMKPVKGWRDAKENAGKFTWTLGLYGTPAAAKEAKLSEKEYWNQIIKACFLDEENPIVKWKQVYKEMYAFKDKLNKLKIEKVHVVGKDVDLWVQLGEKRKWIAGSGRNVPTFEIFNSPNWRGTNGWIKFNQPLYRYGNVIEGIELEFKDGIVIKAKAKKNEKLLNDMIATEGANKVGEFSLTDRRFSRITKFMAHTLYDENVGGPFGNTHIALGSSYHDCYDGDPSQVSKEEWDRLGYNDSSVHTDIISTTDRTVTAYLPNGKEKVIYKDGQFTL